MYKLGIPVYKKRELILKIINIILLSISQTVLNCLQRGFYFEFAPDVASYPFPLHTGDRRWWTERLSVIFFKGLECVRMLVKFAQTSKQPGVFYESVFVR